MIRFFVPPDRISEGRITIEGQELLHAAQVLRRRKGDIVTVMDGASKEYTARIVSIDNRKCIAEILDERAADTEVPVQIMLCQAMIKPARFEVVLEKATELGAASIIPIISEYCSNREKELSSSRRARWYAILKSAACQSGRAVVPKLWEPMLFASAIESFSKSKILLFSPSHGSVTVAKGLEDVRQVGSCSLFLGPEGGFSPDEIALAQSVGIPFVSMGKRILRAETAAIAALALAVAVIEGN